MDLVLIQSLIDHQVLKISDTVFWVRPATINPAVVCS